MRLSMPARRSRALGSLVVIALATAVIGSPAGAATPIHDTCAVSLRLEPSCGVLWGMFRTRYPVAGSTQYSAAYPTIEQKIGRQFDIVKNYIDFRAGKTFPDAQDKTLSAGGRYVFYDWNAVNYSTKAKIPYQSIANGTYDQSVIIPEAKALKAYGYKIFLSFDHENDNKVQSVKGTAAQYAAAYRHIHDVFKAQGVNNVVWVWVTTGYVPHADRILQSYPGSGYVDWIGYDPYNFAQCQSGGTWKTPLQVFQPFYNWVAAQPSMFGKPLMLAEYASAPGSQAAAWYQGVPAALQQLPDIKAAVEFNAVSEVPCDLALDDSSAAMAGFAKAGLSPYVLGTSS